MNRLLILVAAVGIVSIAALISTAQSEKPGSGTPGLPKFDIAADAKVNPWTNLNANADPEQFQFAIVSDRTGGHRKGVFSKAVQQVNLMQPEFVMSVGDLIEGVATADGNRKQWDEFDGYAKQFQMPFFYCPGNHDAASLTKTDVWSERLGKRYYHFGYKGALFIILNTQDYEADDAKDPPKSRGLRIGKQQQKYIADAVKANPNSTWTFVFCHHPLWAGKDITNTGWLEVEEILKGRKYSVYCGHVHRYQKFVRNGMNLYQLATTGGGSALRGIEYGEFDQIAWITMKKDGPKMANVMLSGIASDDLRPFESPEEGAELARDLLPEVVGKVTLDGKPAAGLTVKFTEIVGEGKVASSGLARITQDGTFTIYGPRKGAGLKAGRYAVTFDMAPGIVIDMKAPMAENRVPEKYRMLNTTPFREDVKENTANRFTFILESDKE